MALRARLVDRQNENVSYPLSENECLIGRSQENGICIPDPYISRKQARIYVEKGRYAIENIGSNPVLVNNEEVDRRPLQDNDCITLGTTQLIFRTEQDAPVVREEQAEQTIAEAEKTVFMASPPPEEYGPRLVVVSVDGGTRLCPLTQEVLIIGRASEADLRLDDASVSRKHCEVAFRDGCFVVRNLSGTNPLIINGQKVEEKVLISGDQLKVGVFSLSFLSDRPGDAAAVQEKIVVKSSVSSMVAWGVASALLLGFCGYLFHSQVYTPWKIGQSMKLISQRIDSGDYASAYDSLGALLSDRLPPKQSQEAKALMTKTVLLNAQQLFDAGKLKEAKDFLSSHIERYGLTEEGGEIKNRLDMIRFESGRRMEASGEHLKALQELASVSEDSSCAAQAEQSISRIWLSYQQKEIGNRNRSVDQLLKEAEEHFVAKRYTTPINRNAYAVYKTVLSVEPDNAMAQQRIDWMKAFYREQADRHLQQKSYAAALSFIERYMLIDPDDPDIKEKRDIAKKGGSGAPRKAQARQSEDDLQKRIMRLLDAPEDAAP